MSRKCWSWTSPSSKRESRATRSPRGITPSSPVSISSARRSAARRTTDLEQAEAHARRSLALRTAHNGETLRVLASALMGQHRFAEARELAERLLAMDSTSRTARSLLGEIELELGDYTEAARTFGTLLTVRGELGVAPRFARWEEIRGRPS